MSDEPLAVAILVDKHAAPRNMLGFALVDERFPITGNLVEGVFIVILMVESFISGQWVIGQGQLARP
jgi:hypothetical protein